MLSTELIRTLSPSAKTFYFYFKKVNTQLRMAKWNRRCGRDKVYTVNFTTSTFNYDNDAFWLLVKVYKRLGWKLTMPRYTRASNGDSTYDMKLEKI